MENVGAVKELSKITSHLEARISELEQNNERCSLLKTNNAGISMSDLSSESVACNLKKFSVGIVVKLHLQQLKYLSRYQQSVLTNISPIYH